MESPSICSRCPDGKVEGGEDCDDGNSFAGDGCSPLCVIESGWTCKDSPSLCEFATGPAPVCGDGVRVGGETCDDGNTVDGDGCRGNCTSEPGYTCTTAVPNFCSKCGNGWVEAPTEECDDGHVLSGDGCTNLCKKEAGYVCSGQPSVCVKPSGTICGDGVRSGPEKCDDGNTADDDGCDSQCVRENGYECVVVVGTPDVCYICGDGKITTPFEACDDGNDISGDGCSSSCRIEAEAGWTCDGIPSVCTRCGNSRVDPGETCDVGSSSSDGCVECQAQPGWSCDGQGGPDSCRNTCGNGIREEYEECDDADKSGGDGCGGTCRVERGSLCSYRSPDRCFRLPQNDAAAIVVWIRGLGYDEVAQMSVQANIFERIATLSGHPVVSTRLALLGAMVVKGTSSRGVDSGDRDDNDVSTSLSSRVGCIIIVCPRGTVFADGEDAKPAGCTSTNSGTSGTATQSSVEVVEGVLRALRARDPSAESRASTSPSSSSLSSPPSSSGPDFQFVGAMEVADISTSPSNMTAAALADTCAVETCSGVGRCVQGTCYCGGQSFGETCSKEPSPQPGAVMTSMTFIFVCTLCGALYRVAVGLRRSAEDKISIEPGFGDSHDARIPHRASYYFRFCLLAIELLQVINVAAARAYFPVWFHDATNQTSDVLLIDFEFNFTYKFISACVLAMALSAVSARLAQLGMFRWTEWSDKAAFNLLVFVMIPANLLLFFPVSNQILEAIPCTFTDLRDPYMDAIDSNSCFGASHSVFLAVAIVALAISVPLSVVPFFLDDAMLRHPRVRTSSHAAVFVQMGRIFILVVSAALKKFVVYRAILIAVTTGVIGTYALARGKPSGQDSRVRSCTPAIYARARRLGYLCASLTSIAAVLSAVSPGAGVVVFFIAVAACASELVAAPKLTRWLRKRDGDSRSAATTKWDWDLSDPLVVSLVMRMATSKTRGEEIAGGELEIVKREEGEGEGSRKLSTASLEDVTASIEPPAPQRPPV
jgi:cysteine-rich repeat protein